MADTHETLSRSRLSLENTFFQEEDASTPMYNVNSWIVFSVFRVG